MNERTPENALTEFSSNIMDSDNLGSFYSIIPTTRKDKIMLYNAINNPDKRLGDCINMPIDIKDVLIEIVELQNEETGEFGPAPRIVIIDDKGVSYQCVSLGIMSALKRFFKLFGPPTWDEPVKVMVKQITKGKKQLLSLEAVL